MFGLRVFRCTCGLPIVSATRRFTILGSSCELLSAGARDKKEAKAAAAAAVERTRSRGRAGRDASVAAQTRRGGGGAEAAPEHPGAKGGRACRNLDAAFQQVQSPYHKKSRLASPAVVEEWISYKVPTTN